MTNSRGKRQASRFNPFLALLLVLVAAVGTVVTLEATGRTDFGLARFWRDKPALAATEVANVLVTTQAFVPGEAVDLQHVWDVTTKTFKYQLRDRRDAEKKGLLTVGDFGRIKGRVLKRAKPANEAFNEEKDFLPEGTPPGPAGLVPSGMRMMTLPVERIRGIDVLHFRDRFELKMSVPLDDGVTRTARESLASRGLANPEEKILLAKISESTRRVLLAQNAEIIQPASSKDRKSEVIVALDPEDVDRVVEALAAKNTIFCITHAADDPDAPRQEPEAQDPLHMYRSLLDLSKQVEVIEGTECHVETVRVSETL